MFSLLPDDYWLWGGYAMVAAFVLFLLVGANSRLRRYLSHSVLRYLGRISYGLYAIHFLVLGSVESWVFVRLSSHLGYGWSFLCMMLVGLPINVLGAYWLTVYVDEPATRLGSCCAKKTGELLSSVKIVDLYRRVTKRAD